MKLLSYVTGNIAALWNGKFYVARSGQWPSVRNAHLSLFPTCAACGQTKRPQVHHIKPVHLFPELELDPFNLITLGEGCTSGNHHFLFGHLGDWRAWNPKVMLHADYILSAIYRRAYERTAA